MIKLWGWEKKPRTMLRYAIERLDESVRRHYMSLGRPN